MIPLKEGQKIIAENGDVYIVEKDDYLKSLKEEYNIKSLDKEMERITLKLFKDISKAPEWRIKKTRSGLEIYVEPNTFNGDDVDKNDLQNFIDTIVDITGFGGFQAGYGGWLLMPNYQFRNLNEGDYNNMMTTNDGNELTYDQFISMCKPLINQIMSRDDLPENIDVEKEVIDFCKVNYARYFELPEFDLVKEYIYNQNLSKNWE